MHRSVSPPSHGFKGHTIPSIQVFRFLNRSSLQQYCENMLSKMQTHESLFNYNLTRPYPFRWFTPVAISCCVIAAIVFSFINVASGGYTLIVHSTTDPNATLSEGTWLKHWPSFVTTKVRSTCQSYSIPVKTQIFTNNTALTYTLTDVWRESPDGTRKISSSLTYQNNLLESCAISSIDMDFDSQDRSAVQLSYSAWGAKVSVFATCSINNHAEGPTKFNLTMLYNYVPNTVRYGEQLEFIGSMFLSRNETTKSSLYWGESLLSMSWATTCRQLQDIRNSSDTSLMLDKGTVNFRPRLDRVSDITDTAFFNLEYQFIKLHWENAPSFQLPPGNPPYDLDTGGLAAAQEHPNIWANVDVLAKAAYSTVLTDLGQVDAPHNLLNNPSQLAHFTANFSTWRKHIANAQPGPMVTSYDTAKGSTGALEVKPSVFVLDYVCQVPRRKAMGNLIVSVLVADLVFLQAVWSLYKIAVDYVLGKKVPDSHWCDGCRNRQEAIPLHGAESDDD